MIRQVLDLLDVYREELKEKLTTATPEHVQRYQGEYRALKSLAEALSPKQET